MTNVDEQECREAFELDLLHAEEAAYAADDEQFFTDQVKQNLWNFYKAWWNRRPSPPVEQGWLSVQSCPQDTEICLVDSSWGVRVAFKHSPKWLGGRFQDTITKTDEGSKDWDGNFEGTFQVFHWMPLPSPPGAMDETPFGTQVVRQCDTTTHTAESVREIVEVLKRVTTAADHATYGMALHEARAILAKYKD